MKKYIVTGTSIALILGSTLPCNIISFANSQYISDNLSINTHKSIFSDNEEDDSEPVEFVPNRSITFNEAITELTQLLQNYKSSKDITVLKECVLRFGEVPKVSKSLTNDMVKNSTQLKELFDSIRLECYSLDEIEDQEIYVKLFAEEIFLGWKYDKNINYFKDEFLINGLVNYNKNRLPNIQDRLDYLVFVIDFYNEKGDPYPEYNFIPEITRPSESPVYPDEEQPNIPEGPGHEEDDFYGDIIVIGPGNNSDNNQNNNNNNDNNVPEVAPEENSNTTTYYKAINNKCYKITELTKNGKTTELERVLVDKSEYAHCGIYDYSDFGYGYSSNHAEIDDDYINNNQNELSDYFVYYSVTNNEKAPYYYNTGIRADSSNKSVSYNQLKDSFYQLAIKNKSFTTDGNDKSLYIFDGMPVVLEKNTDDYYTQKDIDRLLKPFDNLSIKIMKDEEYKACLVEYETSQAEKEKVSIDNVIIDGVKIFEKNIAWIENDIIKSPIQTLANLLSAKTSIGDEHLIIEKDNNKIIIYNNKKNYIVNNQQKEFLTAATINGTQYISELADIPKLLGYNVNYDSNLNELVFTKIQ